MTDLTTEQLGEKFGEAASAIREAQSKLLEEIGADTWADAMRVVSQRMAADYGQKPTLPMGTAESARELYPDKFDESLSDPMTLKQVKSMPCSDKLAHAGAGTFEGSAMTVLGNLVLLFGGGESIVHNPIDGIADVLTEVSNEMIRQAYERH